ncbi:hypothetical protein GIB67_024280, partial [Kingdonia uniflora]
TNGGVSIEHSDDGYSSRASSRARIGSSDSDDIVVQTPRDDHQVNTDMGDSTTSDRIIEGTLYWIIGMIEVTDDSYILGPEDFGVQGIGIPIGKHDMHIAAAGMNLQRVLTSSYAYLILEPTIKKNLLEDHLRE